MQVFNKQEFTSIYERGAASNYQDMYFEDCRFTKCSVGITKDPRQRSTFRNIELRNAQVTGCSLAAGIFEDCTVDGFRTNGELFQSFASIFSKVVWKGNIDRVMFSTFPIHVYQWPELKRRFEEDTLERYRSVGWALDISQAKFFECDIRGIPISLIRRDPESQVVVTRMRVIVGDWRNMLITDYWKGVLQVFLQLEEPAKILIAPKRAKNFKELAKGLEVLRSEGVVEPD